jgi:hypothetical protein
VKRVLVDKHHADLFHAMQLLLEDKLGYMVYTPIGHEWWDEGYWQFGKGFGDDRLARQFLNTADWECLNPEQAPGYRTYTWSDPHHPDRKIRGIELGSVKATPGDWTHVVATVQDNQKGFHRLAQELTEATKAAHLSYPDREPVKYVLQVGNTNQAVDWGLDPLAIVSSEVPIQGKGVVIHQPMDPVFYYRKPVKSRTIRSFVNCFNSTPCIDPFVSIGKQLPEFTFYTHGIDGSDGDVQPVSKIADYMGQSLFGWHDKVQGDGFGHVIHDWAAIGRPLIGHASHYAGKMAQRFWIDLETCIDLDKHPIPEVTELVREIASKPTRHKAMCVAIRDEFDKIDWDAEAEAVRELLA